MSEEVRVLVTGAGGFIGHHLVKYLVERGYQVRGVDVKEPEYEPTRLRQALNWEPRISLEDGLERTYHWIAGELAKRVATVSAEA